MDLDDFKVIKMDPPHDTNTWIQLIAKIRKNDTGEIREGKEDVLWDEDENEPHLWIWEEGNFSCDCNRELFFNRYGGVDADETECGDRKSVV